MCFFGNSAPLSAHYISAQLIALWQNAIRCVEEGAQSTFDVTSTAYKTSKATRALAQYHHLGNRPPMSIKSASDLFFCARFGEPLLQFVCNHNAIITLAVDRADLDLDYKKSDTLGAILDS